MPDGWESGGLTDITIPGDASVNDPRIYVGQNDPIASMFGDAAIVMYWGNGRAFFLNVEQSGSPDRGQLHLQSFDPVTGNHQYIDLDVDMVGMVETMNIGQNMVGELVLGATPGGATSIRVDSPTRFRENVVIDDANTIHDVSGLMYRKGQSDVVPISFVTQSQFLQAVVFPVAFPVGITPHVTLNINSAAGATAGWVARASGVTNTGFTIFVFNTRSDPAAAVFTPLTATWASIPVSWEATTDG
jgi:hypothetical protein